MLAKEQNVMLHIVIVEIYNKQLFGDKLVRTITQVQVIDGEVNVKISNSYL